MKKAASRRKKTTRIKPIPSLSELLKTIEDAEGVGSRTDQHPVEKLYMERHPLEQFDPERNGTPPRSGEPDAMAQKALNHLRQRKDELDRSESLKDANRRMATIAKRLARAGGILESLADQSDASPEPGQPLRFVDRPLLTYIDDHHREDDEASELIAMVLFDYFEAGALTDEQLKRRLEREGIFDEFADLDLPGLIKLGKRLRLLSFLFATAADNIRDPGRTEKNTVGSHYNGRYIHSVVHTLWHLFRLTGRYPSAAGDGKFLEAVNLFFDAEEGNRVTIQDYWARRHRQQELQEALRRHFDREVYPDAASWPAEVREFAHRRINTAGAGEAEQIAAQKELRQELFKLWLAINVKHFITASEVKYLWGDSEPPGLQAWFDSNYLLGTNWPVKTRRKSKTASQA